MPGRKGAFVPKDVRWRSTGPSPLAELGFVVVQIDGMGTNWRSRAFHDVCCQEPRPTPACPTASSG